MDSKITPTIANAAGRQKLPPNRIIIAMAMSNGAGTIKIGAYRGPKALSAYLEIIIIVPPKASGNKIHDTSG